MDAKEIYLNLNGQKLFILRSVLEFKKERMGQYLIPDDLLKVADALLKSGILEVEFYDRDNNDKYMSLCQFYSLTELGREVMKND
ncbi:MULTISPECIES: hypothetical protein [Klebsiella]|uniref:hypothetical protein n=1 Tax=Klebsiella TaxID=570 RepID=UPI0011E48C9D|nr:MULTISPECIES: hypothetical protein [Klebsiella]MBZ7748647.1 hypothetical protein [Klebsiella michiganensis]MDO3486935.1 hypothetical protein [Klebsiella pneumoniae]MDO3497475.1 hypothetical protein [Klebsiella pneumoniae]MDO3503933.1 hypothetical protein [Klebsiella pneumoniae]TYE58774.1 hypothetical protein DJ508_12260 [Klebsiella michiganensis]